MTENRARFDEAAKDWDKSDFRLSLAKNITDAILDNVELKKDDAVMDFGCGTGLVGLNIAPFVGRLVGVDLSANMLEAFGEKAKAGGLENVSSMVVEPEFDFGDMGLDVIVSAMALHHVKEPSKQLCLFAKALKKGGTIAIADLAKEDGSFHSDNNGVYHFGFSPEEAASLFEAAGFEDFGVVTAHTVKKPHRDYDILLFTAKKK